MQWHNPFDRSLTVHFTLVYLLSVAQSINNDRFHTVDLTRLTKKKNTQIPCPYYFMYSVGPSAALLGYSAAAVLSNNYINRAQNK